MRVFRFAAMFILFGVVSLVLAWPVGAESSHGTDEFDAELGGVAAILPVVDARSEELAPLGVSKASIRKQVLTILSRERLKVISESDALRSMTHVGVLHIVLTATTNGKSQLAAVKVDVELRRRVLVDCCRYVPLALVWRSGVLDLYSVKDARQRIPKAVDTQMEIFVEQLRAAPKEQATTCDDCRQFDGQ